MVMTDFEKPIVQRAHYEGFATLSSTVKHLSPLDGNSGHSMIQIEVETGVIWIGAEDRDADSSRDFTIQLMGTSEHRNLARIFRDVADQLDAAPER